MKFSRVNKPIITSSLRLQFFAKFISADHSGEHYVDHVKLENVRHSCRSFLLSCSVLFVLVFLHSAAQAQCPSAGTDNSSAQMCATSSVDLSTLLGGSPDGGGVWIDVDNTGQLSGSTFSGSAVPQGFYRFSYVVSQAGCSNDTATVTMLVQTNADAGNTSTATVCASGSPIDLFDQIDGNPDAGGTWSDDDNTGGLSGDEFDPEGISAGTYDFTYTVTNSCTSDNTVLSVTVSGGPTVDAGADVLAYATQTVTLEGIIESGATFTWNPTTFMDDPNSLTTTVRPDEEITYTLTATDGSGCTNADQMTITFETDFGITSAFTPDGDGTNDTWKIASLANFPKSVVKIFDRRGNLVFESQEGYIDPWDGTSNGKPLPVASYYYILELNNGSETMTGTITIIR